jgi:hypothetical protein
MVHTKNLFSLLEVTMNIGMMWQMETGKEARKKGNGLMEDIITAAEYYSRKYGKKVDAVYVNPLNIAENELSSIRSLLLECCNLELKVAKYVLKGNVWIGEE